MCKQGTSGQDRVGAQQRQHLSLASLRPPLVVDSNQASRLRDKLVFDDLLYPAGQ